jgi:hypothetical protein
MRKRKAAFAALNPNQMQLAIGEAADFDGLRSTRSRLSPLITGSTNRNILVEVLMQGDTPVERWIEKIKRSSSQQIRTAGPKPTEGKASREAREGLNSYLCWSKSYEAAPIHTPGVRIASEKFSMSVLKAFLERNQITRSNPLPLVHTTESYYLKKILKSGNIEARPCNVFTVSA